MWRRGESTDESSGSTSSDDNLTTNTTTVERGLFGKSKKKGGPKKHPLKRASFSRMWRRVESTDESSDSTSSDDNQQTKTTVLERDLLSEDRSIRFRKGKEKLRSRDVDEYFRGMKRYSKEGSELKHPAYRRYQKEIWKRTPAENWDSPSNVDRLSDSNHLSKRFENFDVLKRAVHLFLQDDLNSKREESFSEGDDSEDASAIKRMSDLENEKFYTSTRFHQGERRNMDPNESTNSDVNTEESESDDDDDDDDDVDKRTPSMFRMHKKRLKSNRKWQNYNNIKRDSNEGTKDILSDLQKEIDEVEQNREHILEQDKRKRSEWNNFRTETKRKQDEQKTDTDSEENESELQEDIENIISADENDFDDFQNDIDTAADVETAVEEVIEENTKRNADEQASDNAIEKEIEDVVNEISKDTSEDDDDNATRDDPETETEDPDSQATELDVSEIKDEINELEEEVEKDSGSEWSESSDVDNGGADETKEGEYHAAFMNSRPKEDNTDEHIAAGESMLSETKEHAAMVNNKNKN